MERVHWTFVWGRKVTWKLDRAEIQQAKEVGVEIWLPKAWMKEGWLRATSYHSSSVGSIWQRLLEKLKTFGWLCKQEICCSCHEVVRDPGENERVWTVEAGLFRNNRRALAHWGLLWVNGNRKREPTYYPVEDPILSSALILWQLPHFSLLRCSITQQLLYVLLFRIASSPLFMLALFSTCFPHTLAPYSFCLGDCLPLFIEGL